MEQRRGFALVVTLLAAPLLASAQWGTTIAPEPGCPDPAAVKPCLCEYDPYDDFNSFYCRDTISADQLKTIFNSASFPNTQFKEFTAEYCTLSALPADVFGPVTFESISVRICQLSSVDPSVLQGQAGSLKGLNLEHNSLASFPFDVDLPQLESLSLADNKLTAVPALSYPLLEYLNLDLNSISQLDANLLQGTPNIGRLYLQSNRISDLPANLVKPAANLEEISLHHNSLTTIPAGTFDFSGNSRGSIDVDLHANSISSVAADAFSFSSGACPKIFLDFNNLASLDSAAFQSPVALMASNGCPGLYVAGNDIKCDCDLSWLAENSQYMDAVVDGYMVDCGSTSLPDWTSNGC